MSREPVPIFRSVLFDGDVDEPGVAGGVEVDGGVGGEGEEVVTGAGVEPPVGEDFGVDGPVVVVEVGEVEEAAWVYPVAGGVDEVFECVVAEVVGEAAEVDEVVGSEQGEAAEFMEDVAVDCFDIDVAELVELALGLGECVGGHVAQYDVCAFGEVAGVADDFDGAAAAAAEDA